MSNGWKVLALACVFAALGVALAGSDATWVAGCSITLATLALVTEHQREFNLRLRERQERRGGPSVTRPTYRSWTNDVDG